MVDWSRTRAWGEGGYYARIMLNVRGREPEGTVDPADYDAVRDELVTGLESLRIPGESLAGTRVHRPEELYPVCRGIPPDLMAFFGDLHWRSIGSVGTGALYAVGNDTGPDDANHSRHGIFLLWEPGGKTSCRMDDLDILDCAPTMLDRLGLTPPADMRGRVIVRNSTGTHT